MRRKHTSYRMLCLMVAVLLTLNNILGFDTYSVAESTSASGQAGNIADDGQGEEEGEPQESEDADPEETEKPVDYNEAVSPADLSVGDFLKKKTLISVKDADGYSIEYDGTVVTEYEEMSDENLGVLLQDNAIVVETSGSMVCIETMYKDRYVLTERVLRTFLKTGEDIVLGGDILLSEPLVLNDGGKYSIEMNGHVLSLTDESRSMGSVISLGGGTQLTLKDSSADNEGTISGGRSDKGGGICVDGSSKLYMTGGCVELNEGKEGGGIYVSSGSYAKLNDVIISQNNQSYKEEEEEADSGWHFVSWAYNKRDEKTPSESYGGGIHIADGGSCEMTGCKVESNISAQGGGISCLGSLNASDTEVSGNISSNRATSKGGGIYIYRSGDAVLENSIVSGNTSNQWGGGINNSGKLVMTGCTVDSNSTKNEGGGLYVCYKDSGAKTVCKDTVFKANTSHDGGGIYMEADTHDGFTSAFDKIECKDNVSYARGGGMYIGHGLNEIKLPNSTLENNQSSAGGGAIYTYSPLTLTDSTITLNNTNREGGGIYANYQGKKFALNITNSSITGNTAYDGMGGGIWMQDDQNTAYMNLGGGETVIYMNKSISKNDGKDMGCPNIGFSKFRKIRVAGEFEHDSKIGFSVKDATNKMVITRDYGEYNTKNPDTYFVYEGDNGYKMNTSDSVTEVQLLKKLTASAKGYTIEIKVKVTNDADDWDDAHIEYWAKKDHGVGEEFCKYSTPDMKKSIDHGGGEYREKVDCGDAFPSKINVYANFGGGWIHRGWGADVTVWINGVNCGVTHIERELWGNTAKKGQANNWITISGSRYPHPEETDIDQEREINLLDDASKVVSVTCVDQYGVKYESAGEGYFKMENLSFPEEDSFKCLDKRGNKWSFDSTKKDELHNSIYLLKIKSGSNVTPWVEIPISVRFRVPLKIKAVIGNDSTGYKQVYEGEGSQNDVITLKNIIPDAGYKIKRVKKDGVCDIQEAGDGKYNLTLFSQNVILTFETTTINYYIRYDRNAKDESTVTGQISDKQAGYNKDVKLTNKKFTSKKGYVFAGWNTEKDGSGTSYRASDIVRNLSSKQDEIVTLYAQWKDDEGNLVVASMFSHGKLGLMVGVVMLLVVMVVFGVRVSMKGRKEE